MRRSSRLRTIKAIFLSVVLFTVCPYTSHAAVFCVDTLLDDFANEADCGATCGDGTADCSLRDAITAANSISNPGPDEIIFDVSGNYKYTTGDEILIKESLTVTGPGPSQFTVDADGEVTGVRAIAIDSSGGGAIVTLSGLTIRGGKPGAGEGAGIFLDSGDTLTLSNCVVTNNVADSGDGGGLLLLGSTSIEEGSDIHGNRANGQGGGIMVDGGSLTLNDSQVRDNESNSRGGGIGFDSASTLTINMSTISGNTSSSFGGGLALGGTVSIEDSTIDDNTASTGGGGGMAIDADQVTIKNSTISRNDTGGSGGGIMVFDLTPAGEVSLSNSTISGNEADDFGGGIFHASETLRLDFVTVTNNVADADTASGGGDDVGDGGGVHNDDSFGATTLIKNSIVAGNKDPNSDPDCFGTLTTLGFNLIEDSSSPNCSFTAADTDITGEDPDLDELKDNGGPTETHALKKNSPALDAADCKNSKGVSLTEDQRGSTRPIEADGDDNDECDIGAFELFDVGGGGCQLISTGHATPLGLWIWLACLMTLAFRRLTR